MCSSWLLSSAGYGRFGQRRSVSLFHSTAFEFNSEKIFSFARADYGLAYSLSDYQQLRWIMLCYDIWCSYNINLKKRFTKYFPKMAHLIDKMRGAVPKMHIKNHVEACQLLWAFNYIECSGETYGEKIESSWGEGNQAAGSTKEMNDGHRHDMLDDYNGYWNWCKLHKLREYSFN
jgi:hypothetical protein